MIKKEPQFNIPILLLTWKREKEVELLITKLKKINAKNIYSIFGTSLDDLIKQKIIKIPDYIKIDVDGTEHIILKGMKENLKNKKIKSILVEVNKKNRSQFNKIKEIMKLNNFILISEDQSKISKISDKNVFNYIYMRK